MNGAHRRWQLPLIVVTLVTWAIASPAPAAAQDGWSFVITPQVWMSHIAKNGFAAAPNSASVGNFVLLDPNTGDIVNPAFSSTADHDAINPQWGIQVAAQKGRLTLAGAFQYVNFETRNNLQYIGSSLCFDPSDPSSCVITTGEPWAQERVKTTRMDVDFSGSYFFPDLVKNWVDASLGGGLKFIYATSVRQYGDLSPLADFANQFNQFVQPGGGLYTVCQADDCSNLVSRPSVNEDSQIFAATFPMNATVHLTRDARWLLPFSVTPMLGVEHRNDRNVAYSLDLPANAAELPDNCPTCMAVHVNRLDGWKFAWGFTSDLTLRWIITEAVSAYAGMRVQYIKGFDKYLGYGPLVGMSVRFGGK
jgi:hypothetical protein